MTSLKALTTRFFGMTALLVLLIGVPFGLWVFGRSLLPETLPSMAQLWDTLWARDTGSAFMLMLLVIGAIAWLVFAVCVLLELGAHLTGRGHVRRTRFFRIPQSAASALVSAVVAGTFMVAAAVPASAGAAPPPLSAGHVSVSASAVAGPQQHSTVQGASTTAPAAQGRVWTTPQQTDVSAGAANTSAPVGPTWTVHQGDTLWQIAETTLGDPLRYPEIVDLNKDIQQADGRYLASAETWLEEGWQLQLPAGANVAANTPPAQVQSSGDRQITVARGDTLWAIAQNELGDGTRYLELAEVNQIADPNLLAIGQTIWIPGYLITGQVSLPVPVAVVAVEPVTAPVPIQTPTPAPEPVVVQGPDGTPAANPMVQSSPAPAADTPAAPGTPAASPWIQSSPAPAQTTTTPAPVVNAAAPTAQPAEAASAPQQADNGIMATVLLLGGLGALAAGAAWAGLLAARRRSFRRRTPGTAVPVRNIETARAEKVIREKSAQLDPIWLDLALRNFGAALNRHPETAPDVTTVTLSPTRIQLLMTQPVAPIAPFHASTSGRHWVLENIDELLVDKDEAGDLMAPLPALATIGTIGDDTVLVDLERAGALTVQGDPGAAREFFNHLTIELAHNRWSDGIMVSLVGWGAGLEVLNPDRLEHLSTVAVATQLMRARLEGTKASMQAHDTDVLSGRASDIAGDSWMPHVLLVDATGADDTVVEDLHQVVQDLAAAGRATVAVLLTGTAAIHGVGEVIITDDGVLRVPYLLGDRELAAARVSDEEIRTLCELFAQEEQIDDGVEAAPLWRGEILIETQDQEDETGNETFAAAADEVGTEFDDEVDAPEPGGEDTNNDEAVNDEISDEISDDVDDDVTDNGGADSAEVPAGSVVPIRPVSAAAAAKLAAVLAANPTLDADVAEWNSGVVLRPRISVLGPVRVTGPGHKPANRLARYTEVVTYLAFHPAGVTADKMVTDLWPEGRPPAPGTRRQLIHEIRRWMGTDNTTGAQFLPNADNGLYAIVGRLVDSELMRRLATRAAAKLAASDPVGAMADYTAALSLIELASAPHPDDEGKARPQKLWEYEGQSYSWLVNLDLTDDRQLRALITDTAHIVAGLALQGGDLDTARWAAEIGHDADRGSDVPLCDLLLTAKAAGQTERAKRLVGEILEANSASVPEDCSPRASKIINDVFPFGVGLG